MVLMALQDFCVLAVSSALYGELAVSSTSSAASDSIPRGLNEALDVSDIVRVLLGLVNTVVRSEDVCVRLQDLLERFLRVFEACKVVDGPDLSPVKLPRELARDPVVDFKQREQLLVLLSMTESLREGLEPGHHKIPSHLFAEHDDFLAVRRGVPLKLVHEPRWKGLPTAQVFEVRAILAVPFLVHVVEDDRLNKLV